MLDVPFYDSNLLLCSWALVDVGLCSDATTPLFSQYIYSDAFCVDERKDQNFYIMRISKQTNGSNEKKIVIGY